MRRELSRWSSSDLAARGQPTSAAEAATRLFELVREAGDEVDEADFNDALTANLGRGRFLLLIVGDGIREGVEAITEYLQVHAGLHFTLGSHRIADLHHARWWTYRAPARPCSHVTLLRTVVAAPDGMRVLDGTSKQTRPKATLGTRERKVFWTDFLSGLTLDDPEQRMANATNQGASTSRSSSWWNGVADSLPNVIANWEVGFVSLLYSQSRGLVKTNYRRLGNGAIRAK